MVKIPMFTLFRLDLFEALKVKILPPMYVARNVKFEEKFEKC